MEGAVSRPGYPAVPGGLGLLTGRRGIGLR